MNDTTDAGSGTTLGRLTAIAGYVQTAGIQSAGAAKPAELALIEAHARLGGENRRLRDMVRELAIRVDRSHYEGWCNNARTLLAETEPAIIPNEVTAQPCKTCHGELLIPTEAGPAGATYTTYKLCPTCQS
jgi:hypothetical protein